MSSTVAILLLLTWLAWRLYRRGNIDAVISRLPGPRPDSFLTGMPYFGQTCYSLLIVTAIVGNMMRLFDKQGGIDYMYTLGETYGSVVKLNGIFQV
jgi:hypothetical protein